MRLDGKSAIVTGGGSGIGAATAELLSREGSRVVVADIDPDGATRTCRRIVDTGGEAFAVPVDISAESQVAALYQKSLEVFGRLDIVANVAAAVASMVDDVNISEADGEVWRETLNTNVWGTAVMCKYAARAMVAQGGGAIVNVSSMGGGVGASGSFPAYEASKAGIVALTRHVATAQGPHGVRCNAVAPGMIVTEGARATVPPSHVETMLRHTPGGRVGTPTDIAEAVVYLASDAAGYVNGALLVADGGLTCHLPPWADSNALSPSR